jgi:hypothetical protein
MAMLGLVLVASLLAPAPAEAVFKSWAGPLHDGNWNVAGNWNPAGVPGVGDTAYLGDTSAGGDVTVSTAVTVARLYGGRHLYVDGVKLTVTGAPDVTSFEGAEVFNGGTIELAGPGPYQGGITLGRTTGTPSTGSLRVSGAGIKWSGAVVEAAPGLGSATLTPAADVTVEPFTTLQIATRFENHGRLQTDVVTEIVPSAGSASDGQLVASAPGTFLVRPGAGSTFTLGAGSSVSGPGRFEITPLVSGAGTVRVEPGATFSPGTFALYGASRFELGTDAVVGAAELRSASGAGGRFGAGELRATGSSLLLATHLGGGRTVFDGPVRIETVGETTTVTDGAVLRTNGATDWRLGTVDLTSGSWENGGVISIVNGSTGVTALSGPGLLRNSGKIEKTGAGTFFGNGSLESSGTIDVTAGRFGAGPPYGTLTQSAGLTTVALGATLDKLVVLNGGVLKGRGAVRALTNNGGTVEPGSSPGTLSVAGAYAQGAGGRLRMEIDGPSLFDVLAVGGAASLDGTLELAGAYVPTEALRILTAGSLAGHWSTITGPFSGSYAADGVTLGAASPTPVPTSSPAPTPVPTASPVPTVAPTPTPPRITAADVIKLPGRCVSRRRLRLHLKAPAGVKLARATITVDGKRPKVVTGAKLRAPVELRGLPRGRYPVKVAVKLGDGRSFTLSRRYRTCAPSNRSESSHSRSALSASSA